MGAPVPRSLNALQAAGIDIPVLQNGPARRFVEHGDPAKLMAACGLDAAGIEASICADLLTAQRRISLRARQTTEVPSRLLRLAAAAARGMMAAATAKIGDFKRRAYRFSVVQRAAPASCLSTKRALARLPALAVAETTAEGCYGQPCATAGNTSTSRARPEKPRRRASRPRCRRCRVRRSTSTTGAPGS